MALGKWHLTPTEQCSPAGPYDRWPLGRGFERFYGFMGGDTSQYYPDLVYDNHQVQPPRTPEQGYHLTEDLVDHAIEFIADAKQVAPEKPFFMYFCTGAMHAPHHAPREWADKYAGQFDDGWTPTGARFTNASSRSASSRRARSCPRAIPTSRPGTVSAPMKSASTPG
jgi:arylsulfatase A-like enzyme